MDPESVILYCCLLYFTPYPNHFRYQKCIPWLLVIGVLATLWFMDLDSVILYWCLLYLRCPKLRQFDLVYILPLPHEKIGILQDGLTALVGWSTTSPWVHKDSETMFLPNSLTNFLFCCVVFFYKIHVRWIPAYLLALFIHRYILFMTPCLTYISYMQSSRDKSDWGEPWFRAQILSVLSYVAS
jgi:hypothetical protein